jgi:hypothetical protein
LEFAVGRPLLFPFKAEAFGVEADGIFDVADGEEGNGSLDVVGDFGFGFGAGCYASTSII